MANSIKKNVELDFSQVLSGLRQIQTELKKTNFKKEFTDKFTKDFEKTEKIITKLEGQLQSGFKDVSSLNKFSNELKNLTKQINQIGFSMNNTQLQLSDIQLSDDLKSDLEKINADLKDLENQANRNTIAFKNSLKALTTQPKAADIQKTISSGGTEKDIKNITQPDIGAAKEAVESQRQITREVKKQVQIKEDLADKEKNLKLSQSEQKKIVSDLVDKYAGLNAGFDKRNKLETVYATLGKQSNSNIKATRSELTEQQTKLEERRKKHQELVNSEKEILDLSKKYAISQQEIVNKQRALNTGKDATGKPTQGPSLVGIKTKAVDGASKQIEEVTGKIREYAAVTDAQGVQATEKFSTSLAKLEKRESFFQNLTGKVAAVFSISKAFELLTKTVRDALDTISDLDKELTGIAVVTDKTTKQLWNSFDVYNKMAQSLGVTTKDAMSTSKLYYQQGLSTADVMELTTETIKMAKIAGMDFSTATDQMTAALRGFKLEMSDAGKVNDIFSALAAKSAVDTQELTYAITKTASIANSAGMEIQTTSAFLTQMIETTREAPENIGTAMKTIIARFQELKKNPASLSVEVEGETVEVNKVEEALKSANVALRDTSGQFRDLDDVFIELSSKWQGLDRNTQRYIATVSAGSRQQSRFIAMMDDYERTMELVDISQNSAGASSLQFAKTMDSLESKTNQLKEAWVAFYTQLLNSELFKGIIDILAKLLNVLNQLSPSMALAAITATAIAVKVVAGLVIKGAQNAIGTFSKNWEQQVKKMKDKPIEVKIQENVQTARDIEKDADKEVKKTEKKKKTAEKRASGKDTDSKQYKKAQQAAEDYNKALEDQRVAIQLMKNEEELAAAKRQLLTEANKQGIAISEQDLQKQAEELMAKKANTAATVENTVAGATESAGDAIDVATTGAVVAATEAENVTKERNIFLKLKDIVISKAEKSQKLQALAIKIKQFAVDKLATGGIWKQVTARIALAAADSWGAAVGPILIAIGIGVAAVATAAAVSIGRQASAQNELNSINEEATESTNKYLKSKQELNELIKDSIKLRELESKVIKTEEEKIQQQELLNKLAEKYPELDVIYDEEGNAIEIVGENLKDLIKKKKELSALNLIEARRAKGEQQKATNLSSDKKTQKALADAKAAAEAAALKEKDEYDFVKLADNQNATRGQIKDAINEFSKTGVMDKNFYSALFYNTLANNLAGAKTIEGFEKALKDGINSGEVNQEQIDSFYRLIGGKENVKAIFAGMGKENFDDFAQENYSFIENSINELEGATVEGKAKAKEIGLELASSIGDIFDPEIIKAELIEDGKDGTNKEVVAEFQKRTDSLAKSLSNVEVQTKFKELQDKISKGEEIDLSKSFFLEEGSGLSEKDKEALTSYFTNYETEVTKKREEAIAAIKKKTRMSIDDSGLTINSEEMTTEALTGISDQMADMGETAARDYVKSFNSLMGSLGEDIPESAKNQVAQIIGTVDPADSASIENAILQIQQIEGIDIPTAKLANFFLGIDEAATKSSYDLQGTMTAIDGITQGLLSFDKSAEKLQTGGSLEDLTGVMSKLDNVSPEQIKMNADGTYELSVSMLELANASRENAQAQYDAKLETASATLAILEKNKSLLEGTIALQADKKATEEQTAKLKEYNDKINETSKSIQLMEMASQSLSSINLEHLAFKEIGADMKELVDNTSLLTESLEMVEETGSLSVDQFNKLIEANAEYASAIDVVNGAIIVNKDEVKRLQAAEKEQYLNGLEQKKQEFIAEKTKAEQKLVYLREAAAGDLSYNELQEKLKDIDTKAAFEKEKEQLEYHSQALKKKIVAEDRYSKAMQALAKIEKEGWIDTWIARLTGEGKKDERLASAKAEVDAAKKELDGMSDSLKAWEPDKSSSKDNSAYNDYITEEIKRQEKISAQAEKGIAAMDKAMSLSDIIVSSKGTIGNKDQQKKIEEYITKLSKFYNILQKIQNLENKLEDLDLAREMATSAEELTQNLNQSMLTSKELQKVYAEAAAIMAQEQRGIQSKLQSQFGSAVDFSKGYLEINYNRVTKLNEKQGEELEDLISQYEDATEKVREYNNSIAEQIKQQKELIETQRDYYIQMEKKILAILQERDQKEIDSVQRKYDNIKKQDQDYLNSIRKNIDVERALRDKDKQKEDLASKEKRLSLLKRDTSGAYAKEVMQLEKEVQDQRQQMADKEIDDTLAQAEEKVQNQANEYDKEIEYLQSANDRKVEEMTAYWAGVDEIMAGGYRSMLDFLTRYDAEFTTASKTQQQAWLDEWKRVANEAEAFKNMMKPQEQPKPTPPPTPPAPPPAPPSSGGSGGGGASASPNDGKLHGFGGKIYTASSGGKALNPTFGNDGYYIIGESNGHYKVRHKSAKSGTTGWFPKNALKYKEGGMVDYTGPAWVDGSKKKPEAFLSSKDTSNIAALRDVLTRITLPKAYSGDSQSSEKVGDVYYEIHFDVENLDSDYSVDDAMDRMEQRINSIAKQRGVNSVRKVR